MRVNNRFSHKAWDRDRGGVRPAKRGGRLLCIPFAKCPAASLACNLCLDKHLGAVRSALARERRMGVRIPGGVTLAKTRRPSAPSGQTSSGADWWGKGR
jgi:hypothetical protein